MESKQVYQFYKVKGISVFPVSIEHNESGKVDKKPMVKWAHFQNRLPSDKEIGFWSSKLKSNGYGLVTGDLSGIAVVDVDTPDLQQLDIQLPSTICARTISGGTHFYYQQPKGLRNSTKDDTAIPFIDIRAEGGFVVIPPTEGYTWITGEFDMSKIAPFPSNLLQRLQLQKKSIDWNNFFQTDWSEGSRNNASVKLIGHLIASKYRVKPSGAWEEIRNWNFQKCQPPIEEASLRKTFENIVAKEIQQTKSQANYTSIYSSDFSDFLTFSNPYQIISANELVNNHYENDNKWIVENLVPEDGITFIAGNPKSGKSLIGLHLALSIINGENAFGKFRTKKQRVLYIPREDGQNIISERLQKQSELDQLFFCYQGKFFLDTPQGQEQLIALNNELGPNVIIFDSYRRFISGNENDSEITNKCHFIFKSLLNRGVKSIIVIHHINKPRENFSNAQMLRGSSDLWAMLDSLILVEKKKELTRVTQESSRVSEPIDSFLVQLSFLPLNFSFISQDQKPTNKTNLVTNQIKKLLEKNPMRQTEIIKEVQKELEVGETTIKNVIKKMHLQKDGYQYVLPR